MLEPLHSLKAPLAVLERYGRVQASDTWTCQMKNRSPSETTQCHLSNKHERTSRECDRVRKYVATVTKTTDMRFMGIHRFFYKF